MVNENGKSVRAAVTSFNLLSLFRNHMADFEDIWYASGGIGYNLMFWFPTIGNESMMKAWTWGGSSTRSN
jgi:hypothetical protein